MKTNWLAVIGVMAIVSLLFGTAALAGSDNRAGALLRSHQDESTAVPTNEATPVPTEATPVPTAEAPTETPVPPVTTGEHPVMSAIASFFGVPYIEIETLHESGMGMGIIASVYLMSDVLDKTPEEILALSEDEAGWHELLKETKEELKGGKLGSIMSGRRQGPTDEPQPEVTPAAEQEQDRERDKEQKQDHSTAPDDGGTQGNGGEAQGNGAGHDDNGGNSGNADDQGNKGGNGEGGSGKGK